eukprot:COSAG01_NODE_909_length_12785_cov_4.201876_5_plen_171_part_00
MCMPCLETQLIDVIVCVVRNQLKFAAQSGVPIVPAMVEHGFTASGWLGILTAGLLWTKMWDISTFTEDVDSLIVQIVEAVGPESSDDAALEEEAALGKAVTAKETKDELLRLQQAAGLDDGRTNQQLSTKAKISSLVPILPSGVLVTPAMQELLAKLSDASSPRVGFVGM